MSKANDPLLKWRKEFPILGKCVYLISNSLGAMPASVETKMREYADTWASRGVRAWADSWWEMPLAVGDVIAPLIGARAGEVSMHTNVSLMQAAIISCFDFNPKKNRIVYSDLEFPSVMYVYERFATSRGAKITTIRSQDGIGIPTEQILDAIDDRTLLVPVSHVFFKSAYIQDIKSIVEKAHRHGAYVILDAYHSVGIVPVDVRKLGVDILVGGVLKWLCGGPGGAFLWMKPGLRKKLTPLVTGWVAHEHPFAFETKMKYANDAAKFLNGTPAIPALYAAAEGPKIIAQVGVENIRKKSMRQTAFIIEEAARRSLGVISPLEPKRRGGTVTLAMPHGYEISRELLAQNIVIDYRKGAGIRMAPHFYTSDEEIILALDAIDEITASGAYKKHLRSNSKVT
jgi:kynureninase